MDRSQWGSRIGFILASAGSAVGLGAIWKFPYITAQQGGGAFLIIYLVISLTLGLTLMATEMAIGRAGKASSIGAFRKLGGKKWVIAGSFGVMASFLILSFYSVIGGWTIAYMVKSIAGDIANTTLASHNETAFVNFITNSTAPIVYHFIFGALTLLTVIFGVQKGIERISKYLMPLLFILMLVLIARVVVLPNALEGLKFFLIPDFSKVTGTTLLEALGLSFFSLSLGLGIMVTYGSYVSPESKLLNSSVWIILLALLSCILAGFMVLPAVFAFGFEPSAGPGLTFITMPAVFASMPFSAFFSGLFFFLLFIAALTSSISLLEVIASFFIDEFNMRRQNASLVSFILFFLIGVVASLSLGKWSNYTLFDLNVFDFLDKLTQNVMMPVGEFFLALFAAWAIWKSHIFTQLKEDGNHNLLKALRYFLGGIVPVIIAVIFFYGFL